MRNFTNFIAWILSIGKSDTKDDLNLSLSSKVIRSGSNNDLFCRRITKDMTAKTEKCLN